MKIRNIREVTDAEKETIPAVCGNVPGDTPDKPPC